MAKTKASKSSKSGPPVESHPPIPPDGGWGWAVVVASFFSNMIVDGVLYTFGIFYVNLIDAFPDAGKAQISLAGSLLGGMYLIVGPFVSALANKFGCRPVAIVGAVVAAASFVVSTFSTSIEMLLVTYGVIGGVGFGLLYLPSIVMVGLYFDSKRAMATGIAVCGSGIGTFLFAPIATALFDNYGWRGATLVIGGIIFNGIACGLVYLPLKSSKKPIQQHSAQTNNNRNLVDDAAAAKPIENGDGEDARGDTDGAQAETHEDRPMYRKDVFYGGSVTNLDEFKTSPDMDAYIHSVTSIPPEETNCCTPVVSILTTMFDFSLFCSPTFIVICAAGVCGFMGFYSPFVYLADYAKKEGMSNSMASLLISVVGLSNTISRVIAGWLADRPWADSVLIHNVALIIAGLSTCLLSVLNTPVLLFGYAIVFGFSIAAFIALRSIVLCDLLGVQKLTNAFGIVALFQGIALLTGTPLSGAIYDSTGSYQMSFIVAGCIMVLGGIICLPVRMIHRWENRRNSSKATEAAYSMVVSDKHTQNV